MSTTIATQPSIHQPHRRTLLAVAVAAALALGVGAAAVSLTSSDGSASHPTSLAVASGMNLDVHALWSDLSAMPASERDNIAAGLNPSVRTQLQDIAEALAAAGGH
jgi:hypothetical protein